MLKKIWGKKEGSANKAKERLRIIIESRRMSDEGGDELKREIREAVLAVIQRRFDVDDLDLDVQLKQEDEKSGELELNIDIHGIKGKTA